MMVFSPVFFRGVVLIALCGSLHAWENAQTNYKDSYLDKKIMSSTTAGDEGEEDASPATVITPSHTSEDPDEIIPSFDSKRTSPATSKSNPSSVNYSSTSPQSISNTRQHLIKENQSHQNKNNDELPYSSNNRKITMKYQEESSPSHVISDDHMTSTIDYFNESFKNLRHSKDEITSTTSRNINHATSHSTHEYSPKSVFSHDDDSEEKNDDFDDKVHTEEPESHLTVTKHPIDYNKNIDWKNNELKKKTSKKDSLSENVEITDKITLSKTEKPFKDVLKMDKHFIKEHQSSTSTTINSEPLEEYYSTRNNITVSVIDNDKSVKNISVSNESGSNLLEVESVSSEVSKYPKSQAGDPPQSVNSVINSVTAENTDTFNRTPTIKYKTLPENNENKTLGLISLQGKDLPNFEKATIRPIVSDQLKLDESKNTIPVLKWEQSTEPLLKSITKTIKVPENDFNLRNDSTIESNNDIKNKIIPSKKLHIVVTTPSTDVDSFNPLEDLESKSSTTASTVPRANIDFKTKLGLSSTVRTTKNSATSIDSVPEVVKLAENFSTVLELSTAPGVLASETNSPPEMVLESGFGTSTTVSNDILVKPITGFSTRKRPPAFSYLASKVTFPSTDINTTTEPSIITTKISNHSTSTIPQSRRSSSLENVSLNANRTGFSQTESTSVKPFIRWSTRLQKNNSIITTDLPTSVASETTSDNDMTSFSESTSISLSSPGVSSESSLVNFSSLTLNSIESVSRFETSTESPVTTEVSNQSSSSSYVTSESVSVKVSELYSSTEPLNSSETWEENSPSSPLSTVPLSSSSPSYSENFMSTWSSSYPSLTTASLDLRNSSGTAMSSSDFTTESLNPDKTTDYVTPSSFTSSSSDYISQSSTDGTESPISSSQPSSTLDYNLRSSTDGTESPIFSSQPSSTLDYNLRSSSGITDDITSSLSTEYQSSTSSSDLLMSVSSVTETTGTSTQTSPSPEPESTPSSTTGSEFSYTSESVSELNVSESTSQTPDYELLFNSSIYFSSTENTLDGRTSSGSEYPTNATTEFTDYSASSFSSSSSSSSSPSDSSTVMPTVSNSITTTGNINLNTSDSIFEEGTTIPASTVPEFSVDDSSEDDYWLNSNITDHSINKIQQHTVSTTENVLAPIHPTFGDMDSGEDEDDRSKSESPLTTTVHRNITKDITKPSKVLWSKVTIDNNNIFGKNNTNSKSTTSSYQELDNVSVIPGTKDKNFSKPDMTIADTETTTDIHAPKEETTFILHTTSENSKDGNKVSHNWSTEIVPEYLIINTSSSWAEACHSEDHLRNVIIRLFKNGTGRNLHKNQVVFLNLTPHLCKQLESPDSPATIQMSFFSESGDTVSSSLNGDFLRLYRLKGLECNLKIQDVQLMVSSRRVSNDEIMDDSAAIAAIAISCIAVVCIVLLGVLLVILRKRQKGSSYGQRCTPVSIDDYSLDNISVYNSVRRKNAIRASKRSYGNPAFDDPGAVSHPLNFATLANFCTNRAAVDDEFSQIPVVSPKMDELPPGAETKNRYSNVIPLPETRVHLSMPEGGDTLSDYINANFVKGPKGEDKFYIACQAPMQSTVNDFWRMIWEQQSKVILMLTDLHENGVEKCYDYLPPSEVLDCHRLFGDYQVTLKKREVREKYIISSLQLKNLETNLWREVTHMWYMNWPHQGVPEEGTSIIAFLIEARSYMRSTSGSTVVHCSPGTGRTGTILAIDLSIRDFETNRLVDIPKTVYALRRDRAGSVQTKDQYAFIYQVLNIYAAKLTGGALDSI